MKKWCRRILTGVFVLGILGGLAALGASLYVVKTTEERILAPGSVPAEDWDCVLVLGAGVRPDGSPSDMLYDRVRTGLDLYHEAVVRIISNFINRAFDRVLRMSVDERGIRRSVGKQMREDRCFAIRLLPQRKHLRDGHMVPQSLLV